MHERTYRKVTRLETEYFRLLVGQYPELHGTYDALPNQDDRGGQTYTVHLSGQRTDKLMQKVLDAANG